MRRQATVSNRWHLELAGEHLEGRDDRARGRLVVALPLSRAGRGRVGLRLVSRA